MAVIDSQSVRTGLEQSVKGVDGGKKIKGIKRQLAVDSNGFPLAIVTSEANVFKPLNGRWVVERTFSWLESFRQLNRNYEQFLHTSKGIAMAACAMFML
ncbi:MAG: transposase, partial [Muribaculaceae bacterium]|nr:transposase [Muribaculaceae bacterium]